MVLSLPVFFLEWHVWLILGHFGLLIQLINVQSLTWLTSINCERWETPPLEQNRDKQNSRQFNLRGLALKSPKQLGGKRLRHTRFDTTSLLSQKVYSSKFATKVVDATVWTWAKINKHVYYVRTVKKRGRTRQFLYFAQSQLNAPTHFVVDATLLT